MTRCGQAKPVRSIRNLLDPENTILNPPESLRALSHNICYLGNHFQVPTQRETLASGTKALQASMPVHKVMKKFMKLSFARLSPLAKGRIVGMREKGAERAEIMQRVKKQDGKSPSLKTVVLILQRFDDDPDWDGVEDWSFGLGGECQPCSAAPHTTPNRYKGFTRSVIILVDSACTVYS